MNLYIRRLIIFAVIISSAFLYAAFFDSNENYACESCNVVYISIDPLSADHMGAYGYERNTTPNIDMLAEDSYVFTRAFSQSSHTMPALYSTFSSTYPSEHGVFPGSDHSRDRNITMLAEMLKKQKYDTFSLNGGANINEEFGFGQGFDEYRQGLNESSEGEEKQYDYIREKVRDKDGKFFFFYQSFRTHDPYFVSDEYTALFGPSLPAFRNESREEWAEKVQEYGVSGSNQIYDEYRDYYFGKASQNETIRRYIESQYDGSIRRSDDFLGGLIDILKEENEYDETIIIVNSQHGEQFYEHGGWRHDTSLYNEVIRVPLMIRVPGQEENKVITSYVENIDLSPTIIDMINPSYSAPKNVRDQWRGVSLVPLFKDQNIEKSFILAERQLKEKAFIDISSELKYYNTTSGEKFYNLSNDFQEQKPLNNSKLNSRIRERSKAVYEDIISSSISTKGAWPYFD